MPILEVVKIYYLDNKCDCQFQNMLVQDVVHTAKNG